MDLHYKQEITVGFLIIAAALLVTGGLWWLSGRTVGTTRTAVAVQFETVTGLTVGDPVQIAGVTVGRVASVALLPEGRGVLVRLDVNENVRPRIDASAQIKSIDFMGARYVAYRPGTAPQFLPEDATITGIGESDLAANAGILADRAAELLLNANDLLTRDMATQVKATLSAAERALDVMSNLGDGPMVDDASSALQSLAHAAARLDSTLSNRSIEESVNQLDEITESVREMTEGLALVTTSLGAILQKVDTAEGTVGKLLSDTLIYNDVHEVLVSLRKLLDDVRERPGRYVNIKVF